MQTINKGLKRNYTNNYYVKNETNKLFIQYVLLYFMLCAFKKRIKIINKPKEWEEN